MGKTGNVYGVIKLFRESILLRLLLTYWGRRVCILKVVMLLKTKLTQQNTKNFSITRLVPAQDVHFFYTSSHLSALKNCALNFSNNFQFIFIFKKCTTQFSH